MGMAVWILFCLFCSVGLVQCIFWILDAFKKPENLRRGYHVIPLYDCPDEIEAQIRFGLSQIRRAGLDGEIILLVDMGLKKECQEICERLVIGAGGAYICSIDELGETICNLDNLQSGANAVE